MCLLCRPIRKKGCATWDGSNSTWGGRVRVFGTVPMCLGVQERAGGEGRVLTGSDAACSDVIALRTQVSAQRTEITDLRAPDRRFQTTVGTQQEEIRELRAAHCKLQVQFIRALNALKTCQTQLTAALGRIQILEAARVPAQLESSAATAARLKEPVRDDLYKFVDTVERGEGSTPAAIEIYAMDSSDAARSDVIALRTQEEIRELRAAHCKLQVQFIRALNALKTCQTQLTAALGRIQILEAARVPAQLEVSEEAGSSS
nr:hypothetical protein [Tanacetum cinerariifolium]